MDFPGLVKARVNVEPEALTLHQHLLVSKVWERGASVQCKTTKASATLYCPLLRRGGCHLEYEWRLRTERQDAI